MSLSIYPSGIPKFIDHRNLLDDVDAGHINAIQRELSAVSRVVGTNPHIYNDVQIPAVEVVATPQGDTGGMIDDVTWQSNLTYYNPTSRAVNHGTVGNRLDNVERGQQNHCFKLAGSSFDVSPGSTSFTTRPRPVRFVNPGVSKDPFAMYNGIGVTLRKSGFWVFHGSVVTSLQGTDAQKAGNYQAAIDIDSTWLEGMHRQSNPGSGMNLTMNPTVAGFYSRGQRITLRFSHDASITQRVRLARLSGFLIRETA